MHFCMKHVKATLNESVVLADMLPTVNPYLSKVCKKFQLLQSMETL